MGQIKTLELKNQNMSEFVLFVFLHSLAACEMSVARLQSQPVAPSGESARKLRKYFTIHINSPEGDTKLNPRQSPLDTLIVSPWL